MHFQLNRNDVTVHNLKLNYWWLHNVWWVWCQINDVVQHPHEDHREVMDHALEQLQQMTMHNNVWRQVPRAKGASTYSSIWLWGMVSWLLHGLLKSREDEVIGCRRVVCQRPSVPLLQVWPHEQAEVENLCCEDCQCCTADREGNSWESTNSCKWWQPVLFL